MPPRTATVNDQELGGFLVGTRLETWKQQRLPVAKKWARNTALYRRDASLDPDGLFAKRTGAAAWESDALPDLTGHKVDSGWAMLTRVMFHGGRVNYTLTLEDSKLRAILEGAPRAPADGETGGGEGAVTPDSIQMAVQEHQRLLDAQLEFFDAPEEMGAAFHSAALLGEGYVETNVRPMAETDLVEGPGGEFAPVETVLDAMAPEFIPAWDVFRDREARTLDEGDGYAIRRPMTPSMFYDRFVDDPLADLEVVRKVLQESSALREQADPERDAEKAPKTDDDHRTRIARTIDALSFWATVPEKIVRDYERKRAQDGGQPAPAYAEDGDTEAEELLQFVPAEVHAVVVNTDVVRFARVAREDRTLREVVWKRIHDSTFSEGVADDVEEDHKMLIKAVRQLENQIVICCSLILAGKRDKLDGDLALEPYTFIDLDPNASLKDALEQVDFSDKTASIQQWIRYVLSAADLSSKITRSQQGAPDGQQPGTLGELVRRLEQSGEWTLSVIRNADRTTEDVLRDMAAWNMANPEIPARLKGNFKVKANGVATFTNRVVKQAQLTQLLGMVLQHPQLAAMTRLKWLWRAVIEAAEVNPELMLLTPDEMVQLTDRLQAQAQTASAAGGAQPDPQMYAQELARLAAETLSKRADAELKMAKADEARGKTVRERAVAVAKLIGAQGAQPAADQPQVQPAIEPQPQGATP